MIFSFCCLEVKVAQADGVFTSARSRGRVNIRCYTVSRYRSGFLSAVSCLCLSFKSDSRRLSIHSFIFYHEMTSFMELTDKLNWITFGLIVHIRGPSVFAALFLPMKGLFFLNIITHHWKPSKMEIFVIKPRHFNGVLWGHFLFIYLFTWESKGILVEYTCTSCAQWTTTLQQIGSESVDI